MNSFPNTIKAINNKVHSNRFVWLLVGGSLGLLVILISVYGLTRPCVFAHCPEIKEAKKIIENNSFSFNSSVSVDTLLSYQKQLQKGINLLQSIPMWSSYYQEATIAKQDYQDQFQDLSSLILAKNKANEALSLSKKSLLSIQELNKIKEKWQESRESLQSITQKTKFKKLAAIDYQRSQNAVESINQKIQQEKEANKNLKLAENIEKLALERESKAQNVNDFDLVYNTWDTAIKTLHKIPPLTSSYQSSRRLLKTYLLQKKTIKKRKEKERIAVEFYEVSQKYAKLAKEFEQKRQWNNAVDAWNNAFSYLNKIPQNTFQWNKIQPLISTYNLSLNQANDNLKQAIKYQKIISELDIMCLSKEKICQYEIKDNLIKMRLESHYLEQLWNLALQAKVQANLEVQVDILNHLATFEHRLQNISNQTGKSIEVYNSQGNLMTLYHR